MRWMRCVDCSHVFTDGYFTEAQEAVLFRHVQPNQIPGAGNMELGRLVSSRIVERVEKALPPVSHNVSHGKWLDVGFGDGALLMAAQEYGFEPVGVDVRPDTVEGLRKFGIEAYQDRIENARDVGSYTVVSMADVLEHVPYPTRALNAAYDLLMFSGMLFVSCPNMDLPAWRWLNANDSNPYWIEIEHFHNFTKKRLFRLLEDCGFVPFSYSVSERYRLGMEIIARKA